MSMDDRGGHSQKAVNFMTRQNIDYDIMDHAYTQHIYIDEGNDDDGGIEYDNDNNDDDDDDWKTNMFHPPALLNSSLVKPA